MKAITTASLTAALGALVAIPAMATPPTSHSALVGVWANMNPSTRSIVRVVVRPAGTGITVQPFGACSPTPCDHGVLQASAFAGNVSSPRSIGFNAMKNFGFVSTNYNGFLSHRVLTLLTQSRFATGDSRFDYTVMERFRKVSSLVPDETGGPVRDDHTRESDR